MQSVLKEKSLGCTALHKKHNKVTRSYAMSWDIMQQRSPCPWKFSAKKRTVGDEYIMMCKQILLPDNSPTKKISAKLCSKHIKQVLVWEGYSYVIITNACVGLAILPIPFLALCTYLHLHLCNLILTVRWELLSSPLYR